jgi:putative Holliday junction resolvase
METSLKPETILAIDVGTQRIGVARAYLDALFPHPLTTLEQPDRFIDAIVELTSSEKAGVLVIGLPRGLNGQETAQTVAVREFGQRLENQLNIPVYWSDEAVTSVKAEAELRSRGKPYAKGDIDALAAVFILEDFITTSKREHPELLNA